MQEPPSRIVLVTGASRGVGSEVARRLADPATHVIVNYRQHADHADAVVSAIRAAGGQASTHRADVSDGADTAAMLDSIGVRFGRLDALILNAAGGAEFDADPRYAMRLNGDAQRRIAMLATPLMPAGSHIVYVTSHQAHFFPHKAVPKGYATTAASKRAGETALHAMRATFDRAGIQLTVVSGDVIEGTAVVRLLRRRDLDAVESSRSAGGSTTDFAAAIVHAALDRDPRSITYIGGVDRLLTA